MKSHLFLLKNSIIAIAVSFFLIGTYSNASAEGIKVSAETPTLIDDVEIEPSGIVPIADGSYLLVADDNTSDLLVMDQKTGKVLRKNVKIPRLARNPDWEAMAKDGEDFYLIGSRGYLVRFRLNEEEKDWSNLRITGSKEIAINNFDLLKREFKGRKPEIEGLAIQTVAGKKALVLGVREHQPADIKQDSPIHFFRAQILDESLTLEPFFSFVALNPVLPNVKVAWHLSSIERAPEWNGFLVITTTEKDDRYYGSILWFVHDDQLKQNAHDQQGTFKSVVPINSEVFEASMKAEGLTVLPSRGAQERDQKLRVVIVFDNDSRQASALMVADISRLAEPVDTSR